MMLMPKSDPDQSERFRDAARKAGANESDDALDRAFGKLKVRTESNDRSDATPPAKERRPSDRQR